MELLITDRNFSCEPRAEGTHVVEVPKRLDDDGVEIPFRPAGEFLIKRQGSLPGVDEWGVTTEGLAEQQRVAGRALGIAAKQKTRMANVPEPKEPRAVVQPEKFTQESPVVPVYRVTPDSEEEEARREQEQVAFEAEATKFDSDRAEHSTASTKYSQYKEALSEYEKGCKERETRIASTEEAHSKRQTKADLLAEMRALVETKLVEV